jgi:hypothetical protein
MTKFIGAERAMIRNSLLTASCHFLAAACDAPVDLRSADGGDRTHTHLRELDFESSASANSATSAFVRRQFVIRLPPNASANGPEPVYLRVSPYLLVRCTRPN